MSVASIGPLLLFQITKYSIVPTDDLIKLWMPKVKDQCHRWQSRWRRYPHRCWYVEVYFL